MMKKCDFINEFILTLLPYNQLITPINVWLTGKLPTSLLLHE